MSALDRRHAHRSEIDARAAMREMVDVVREAMRLVRGVQGDLRVASGLHLDPSASPPRAPRPVRDPHAAFDDARELMDRANHAFTGQPPDGPAMEVLHPIAGGPEAAADTALDDALETLLDPSRLQVPTFGMESE